MCRADRIGGAGVSEAALSAALEALVPALDRLRAACDGGTLPMITIAGHTDDLAAITETAARLAARCADVLVLGTGGSSLGGRCFCALGRDPTAPRLHFFENVDPDGFEDALDGVDLARAGLLIVSKSGATAETLALAFALLPRLADARGAETLAEVTAVITDPTGTGGTPSPLRALAADMGLPILDHPPAIGGRFAGLTTVGLLPASLAGIRPQEVRAGAAGVVDTLMGEGPPADIPPALGAALTVAIARERGLTQSVMMPYPARLKPFADWHRQLWAESLGKDAHATTPIAAQGTVDQHSQLQLWLDGPADKLFTLIFGRTRGSGPSIAPPAAAGGGLDWLRGRRMGDLLVASQAATRDTLTAKGRPVRVIEVARADGRTLGALMMHFMVETILAGDLLGVDPFGQPAVEAGKALARQSLAAMAQESDAAKGRDEDGPP
ncbi:MAG: glucose-6-phosphate isomerase [Alphaproteobacteria bacterium]|nr:glucose-6-phosphate isomerase [Alphaproteobacteria bacterium]